MRKKVNNTQTQYLAITDNEEGVVTVFLNSIELKREVD